MKFLNFAVVLTSALLLWASKLSAETIEYVFYDPEGVAGHEVITREDNRVSGTLELGWNNRRIKMTEEFELGPKGIPTFIHIKGISPGGAPVEETFTLADGLAEWKGSDERGSAKSSASRFFVPKNPTIAMKAQLAKALLASPGHTLKLLPQGQAQLEQLDKRTVKQGDMEKTIYLYGVSGLDFTPFLAWYDEEGDLFASHDIAFFAILRKGWDKSHLQPLKEREMQAGNEYLQSLASKHTHQSETPILINNVNIVDVEQGELLRDRHLLIEDGKITRISLQPIRFPGVTRINARGMTLMPGLWDMHGHMSPEHGLLNMAAGVISVRDIGNAHEKIMRTEELFDSGKVIGGPIYRAGFIDRDSENAMRLGKTVKSLEEAKAAADWYADRGYMQIKTYSSMEPEWIAPLAEHVHKRGMRLSGHIPAFMTAEEAVDAGFDEIQHINMLFLNFMGSIDTRKKLRFTEVGEHGHEIDLDSAEVAAFLDKLAEKGTVVDATVTVFRSLLQGKAGQLDPEYQAVADHLPVDARRNLVGSWLNIEPEHRENYNNSSAALLNMLRKLHEHNVPMVAGTDGLPGFTLLRELELYAEAGIPNADVLRTATIEPAKVVGALGESGTVDVGKKAHLVLLDGNPLEDITALRRSVLVIEGQNLYRPDELYQAVGIKPFIESVPFRLNGSADVATN
ncbi:amidohydrolase family protein [Microbulbifer guangxiensis]|uniref:amidohydrolase family protein n=1 Tax=Microbulbifer guangxiensis TaxID=2904249 RepID=UPI001F485B49|nr:amidohydrolase family protein [Microbulbifer guangxiensis]